MNLQTIVQERNNTLLQLAQAHIHASEIRAEIERLTTLGAQLAADIRNMETKAAGLVVAQQAMEQQPAVAQTAETTT